MTIEPHSLGIPTPTGGGLLLGAAEAAELVGCSPRTWRRWERGGLVPGPVYLAGRPRWRRADLLAWVAQGCPRALAVR